MSIWFKDYKLEDWDGRTKNTIHDSLGIEMTEVGPDFVSGKMPVDDRTVQPMRLLHGGASVVLAESLGSIAATMVVDPEKFYCVGQSIFGNHLRPATEGFVYGTARPAHIGRKTQLWEIEIVNEAGKVVHLSRLTMAVVEKA
ncbi:MAG TPA: esterase [Flavobacteriales bacterium]|jgi:1,4-dihydroxy-2-naphthoyl-CoA hydrolase|nr:hotdog fold thioesterase [Salibacteraceae bacterium]HAS34864.1 esterase [Flavobacteriales bacterium]